jgi:carbon-monoxide dehydrogenase large subunit
MPPDDLHLDEDAATIAGAGRRRIGEPVQRAEDATFLRGAGRYSDDLNRPGQLYAAFVRSPVAHGKIRGIDTTAAAALPGVVAVLTGHDYAADGNGPVIHRAIEGDPADWRRPAFGAADPVALEIPQWPMPADKVRHVGEPLALVIAENHNAALDAVGRVDLDIDPLPAIVDLDQAAAAAGPPVHDVAPGNLAVHARRGDAAATAAEIAACDLVVSGSFVVPRLAGGQMEPRAGLAEFDPVTGRYTVTAGNQGVHRYRDMIASALKVEKDRVRVVCPDTGGGFGPRGHANPEYPVIAWAAKRLGRPVKWTGIRSEAFVSDWQGRDMRLTGELGVMRDGTIRAYRLTIDANKGAYAICYAPAANASRLASTVYDIAAVDLEVKVWLTNTLPVLPFRAAGRPEVHYAIERLIDKAAVSLGLDRIEMRRRNLVAPDAMPWISPLGLTYEVCAFDAAIDRVAKAIDWTGFPARRAEADMRGRRRGIAISPFIESPVGAPFESARLEIAADGAATLHAGTQNHGQSHATTYAQVISDRLGLPFERIALAQGDSDALTIGGGTHSDRSMRMVGTLLVEIAADLITQARPVAAQLLQANADAIEFTDGGFRVPGGDQSVSMTDVAAAFGAFHGDGRTLQASAVRQGRIPAFPYGAAAAEIEIDPETGALTLCGLAVAHDCGTPVNPMVVHGQAHGGLVQGVGQAIGEAIVYEAASGQLLSGSFMDYMMPRADQFPPFAVDLVAAPTPGNPLGVRAGGEGGCVPALAIVGNAVHDALADLAAGEVTMPFTASTLWRAIAGSGDD